CEPCRLGLEAVQLPTAAEPKMSLRILADAEENHRLAARRIVAGKRKPRKRLACRIEPAEDIVARPDRAPMILEEDLHEIAIERIGVPRIVTVVRQPVAIVPVQPALRPEPQKAMAVLEDRENIIIGEPVGGCEMVE